MTWQQRMHLVSTTNAHSHRQGFPNTAVICQIVGPTHVYVIQMGLGLHPFRYVTPMVPELLATVAIWMIAPILSLWICYRFSNSVHVYCELYIKLTVCFLLSATTLTSSILTDQPSGNVIYTAAYPGQVSIGHNIGLILIFGGCSMHTVEHQIIHFIKFSCFFWGRTNSQKLYVAKMDGENSHHSSSAKIKLIASVVADKKNVFLDLHLYEHLKLGRLGKNSIVLFYEQRR